MTKQDNFEPQWIARWSGGAVLASILVGIGGAMTISHGIDINMTADIVSTAENMLGAETRLHAKAYLGLLLFALDAVFVVGLYLLLRSYGHLLAGWSLLLGLAASVLSLLGTVYAMNAAHLAGNEAFTTLTDDGGRKLLAGLQATSDYTSFHLALVIASVSKAGFFTLFLRARSIPKLIAGFGVFASLFVAVTLVARDFIPALGANAITISFMICNLVALLALGLYLSVKGVKQA